VDGPQAGQRALPHALDRACRRHGTAEPAVSQPVKHLEDHDDNQDDDEDCDEGAHTDWKASHAWASPSRSGA
jgi:hypothetical protein